MIASRLGVTMVEQETSGLRQMRHLIPEFPFQDFTCGTQGNFRGLREEDRIQFDLPAGGNNRLSDRFSFKSLSHTQTITYRLNDVNSELT